MASETGSMNIGRPWSLDRLSGVVMSVLLVAPVLMGCIRDAGDDSATVECMCTPEPFQGDPRWMERARVANADLDPQMSAAEWSSTARGGFTSRWRDPPRTTTSSTPSTSGV